MLQSQTEAVSACLDKMIYQCCKCDRFVDENEGAVIFIESAALAVMPHLQRFMAFKCKYCLKGDWEEIKKEAKNKIK